MSFWTADRSVSELAKRWALPPSKFIEIDGMLVHVRDEGAATAALPIVLVHGTGNSLHTWDGWAQLLKASHRVIRFDRPGFGLTGPNQSGDYSMAACVKFVAKLLDALGVERCILAGNSLGGRVAWSFAVAHPERVEKLVLLASSGYPRSTPLPFGFRIAMSPAGPFMMHVVSRKTIDKNVRNAYGNPAKVTQENLDRSYEMTLAPGVRDALGATLRAAYSSDDSADIAKISMPTLVIWGAKDNVSSSDDAAQFKRDVANCEVVIMPGVGHMPQEEAPDESVAILERFI